ncbi:MAG: hypothetical protein M1828_002686 [Chrysothrix sp. TS-e1954]|nr:MAG: hypothetical protein M1828_002686 [Chrysothrix sp. TS-e1954]
MRRVSRLKIATSLSDRSTLGEQKSVILHLWSTFDECAGTPAVPVPPVNRFHAAWYTITDRMTYLPGVKGKLTYNVCFHDLANGVQTHVYAPTGVDIKDKWTVCGNEPGEPRQPVEIGLNAPKEGLYLREDVDITSNVMFTKVVKEKNIQGHKVMVDRLIEKAKIADRDAYNENIRRQSTLTTQDPYASQLSSPGLPPNSPYTQPYPGQHPNQQDDARSLQYVYGNEKSPAYQNHPRPAWAQPAPAYDNRSQPPTPGQHPAYAQHAGLYNSPHSGAMELPGAQYPRSSPYSSGHEREASSHSRHTTGSQTQSPYPQVTEMPTQEHKEPAELA